MDYDENGAALDPLGVPPHVFDVRLEIRMKIVHLRNQLPSASLIYSPILTFTIIPSVCTTYGKYFILRIFICNEQRCCY